jgi:hypothetical protein
VTEENTIEFPRIALENSPKNVTALEIGACHTSL